MEFGGGDMKSYYAVLGLRPGASKGDLRSAYRKLAMRWHPDRWARDPASAEEAKKRFQAVQEAYEVLSDHNKRTLYDAGLYDGADEEVEGFSSFLQEMVSLMASVRREEKSYSLEELRQMLGSLADGFEPEQGRQRGGTKSRKRSRGGGGGSMEHVAGRDVLGGQQAGWCKV